MYLILEWLRTRLKTALLNIMAKETSLFLLVYKFSYHIALTNLKNYMDLEISNMHAESQLQINLILDMIMSCALENKPKQ